MLNPCFFISQSSYLCIWPYLLLYRLSKLTLLNQLLMGLIFLNYNSTTVERKIIYCVWFEVDRSLNRDWYHHLATGVRGKKGRKMFSPFCIVCIYVMFSFISIVQLFYWEELKCYIRVLCGARKIILFELWFRSFLFLWLPRRWQQSHNFPLGNALWTKQNHFCHTS